MTPPVWPLHLGPLHPVEQLLTLLLAFGPFAVLGVVVVLRRRSDARAEADAAEETAAAEEPPLPEDSPVAENVDPGPTR